MKKNISLFLFYGTPTTKKLDDDIPITHFWDFKYRYSKQHSQTINKLDDSTLVAHLSGFQVSIVELQIIWRYADNAFVGFQHLCFWESNTYTFQISIKLALCHRCYPLEFRTQPFLFETFQMYLMISLLYEKNLKIPKSILFYRLTDNISETRYNSYNMILVLECKITQHNTGGK